MTIDPTTIKQNSWTENLGDDFIAVDALGNVLARANDRASAEQAAPGHAGIFGAKDLKSHGHKEKAEPTPAAPQKAAVEPKVEKVEENDPQADDPTPHRPLKEAEKDHPSDTRRTDEGQIDNPALGVHPEGVNPADGSAFDHDSDGHVGGSRRKRKPLDKDVE